MTRIETVGRGLGRCVVRSPWLTIVLSLAVVLPFGIAAKDARFSTDYRVFFGESDPRLHDFDALESSFTPTDDLLLVVRPREDDVFDEEVLSVVRALTEAAWQLPHVSRVDSLTTFQRIRSEDDELIVEPLVSPSTDVNALREIAMAEPMIVGALLAHDGKTTGIHVTLRLPHEEETEVTQSVDAARALAARVAAEHPSLEVRVSGMAAFNDAFREASVRDMTLLFPLMLGLMLITMSLLLRSIPATIVITGIVTLSSMAALGLAGLLGYPLTPPSAATPTIVLTLAVAEGIHLVSGVRDAMRNGHSRRQAIVETMRTHLRPVLLTSVTTIFGFLCLNTSDAPPYQHLANMASLGIVMALFLSLTLLPALLTFIPLTPASKDARSLLWARWICERVIKSYRAVLAATAVLAVVAAILISRMETNDHFLSYFDRSLSFRGDTEFVLEHLTGIYSLEYAIDSGAASGVTDPAYLERLDAFAGWLRAQPEVVHVTSFSDAMARVNRHMHGGDPAFEHVPADREFAAQSLLLYELSLPPGTDLTDRLDIARSSSRVTVLVRDLTSQELRQFAERSEAWLSQNTPRPMWSRPTSPVVVFSYMSDRNARSMSYGNLIDLVAMSIALIVAFRSIRLGILSMVPNVLPILVTYGLWALFVGDNNIVVSVAGTICLGIVVDDTIHFMSNYQSRRREGATPEDAIRETFGSVGIALIVTTTVLVVGFAVMTFSGFQMNQQFGMLAVAMITIALPGDLLVLPALLLAFDRTRTPAISNARQGDLQCEIQPNDGLVSSA